MRSTKKTNQTDSEILRHLYRPVQYWIQ